MQEAAHVPFVDWRRIVSIGVTDYGLTFAAAGAMVVARAWGAVRVRNHRGLAMTTTPIWPAAFYWPVYVWGLQAPQSLTYHLFAGVNYGGSHEAYQAASVYGWDVVYASVLPLCFIAHLGAATQGLVNGFRNPSSQGHISLPFSVAIVVLGVYFMNSAVLVLLGTVAYNK
jgi:hypothetical protein